MSTVILNQFRAKTFGATVPDGNASVLPFQLIANAAGGAVGADSAAPLAIGDVVVLGPLPEGMRLDNFHAVVSTAFTAAVTGSLGFKYEDGVDSATVPQDAAYFGSGIVLSSAARLSNASAKAIVTLPKPAVLILTTAGAANAKAAKLDIIVSGELLGPR